jgi:hypothetical protein
MAVALEAGAEAGPGVALEADAASAAGGGSDVLEGDDADGSTDD